MLLNVLKGCRRIFDGVVQQRGYDRSSIQLVFGQYSGNFQGMGKIGIAGSPLLRAMHFHGVDIGPVENVLVRSRVV